MKTLMLYKKELIASTLLFLCLFLVQCKKDIVNPTSDQFDTSKQLIKEEAITNLLNENPAAQLLSLDWKKSQQAIINGKRIVRVPILNVNKLMNVELPPDLRLNENIREDKKMNGKIQSNGSPSGTGTTNPNYFEKHPPELFFVQKENSDKVNAFLLNFVPTDINNEFGENNLWTGKLYEWDLTGDTLIVQDIIKSKLKDRYGLTNPENETTTSSAKPSANGKQLNLKDQKVSSIFGYLIDKVADVIGWLAKQMGIPTEPDPFNNYGNGGVRIAWSKIFPAGTGGEQTTTDTIAGDEVYGSYMQGFTGDSGGYNPFPHGPNPNGGEAFVHYSIIYLGQVLSLGFHPGDAEKLDFLAGHIPKSMFLMDYLKSKGATTENIEFVYWSLNYLMSNPSFDTYALGAAEKLILIKNLTLNSSQKSYIETHHENAIVLAQMLKQDANIEENKAITEAIVEELADETNNTSNTTKADGLTSMIKNAISRSIIETAIITRKLYLNVKSFANNNPKIISGINSKIINPIRSSLEVNLNPQTLEWRDLFNIWFFELGTFPVSIESSPTIKIYQGANVINANGSILSNALDKMPSVNNLRERLLNSVKSANVPVGHMVSERYNYNVNEYYGSLVEQNTAKIFLGSFNTEVYVSAKSGNSATFLFVVKNVSGWESATRFIKASGSTPTGIIDNKPRGTGLNIGGNFAQDIEWTETITW